MKQKPGLHFHTKLCLSFSALFCVFCCSANESTAQAQGLQTSSTNQTQRYGQWTPPNESQLEPPSAARPTKETFRDLFPPTNLRPMADRSAMHYPLQPKKPAPLAEQIPNARPLQPITQNNFIQGTFSQDPSPGGDFARVNHHEASTAEAAMPLPKSARAAFNDVAPQFDMQAQVADWTNETIDETSESSMSGIVGSIQSGSKNFMDGFQSKGGWGEKIASFFTGQNNQTKKVFGSLALVIGGYLAFVWLMRKFNISSNRGIPSEVIEVIGNAPFGPRKNLQLVRLGSKLLLLMNGPEGTHPVGEITDPEEVDYLISLCNGKSTKATRSVMSVVDKLSNRASRTRQDPRRTLQPTAPAPTESTFSTSQLVQALESLQNSNRSNTVFEA